MNVPNTIVLVKGADRYVIVYDDEQGQVVEAMRQLGRGPARRI